jgi:acyl-CoA synthetase (NDP forming)
MSRRIASDTARRPAAFSAALIRDAFVAGSCPKWLMSAPRALAEKGRPKRSRDLHGSGAVGIEELRIDDIERLAVDCLQDGTCDLSG